VLSVGEACCFAARTDAHPPLERREAEEPARIAVDDLVANVGADGDKRRFGLSVGAGVLCQNSAELYAARQ